jgi:hypothetical protein
MSATKIPINIKMFVKPQTREDLQIQMNILKGNHLMLKTRFNKYFEGMKIQNSQDYTDLIQSLRELHKAMAEVSMQLHVSDLRLKKIKNLMNLLND